MVHRHENPYGPAVGLFYDRMTSSSVRSSMKESRKPNAGRCDRPRKYLIDLQSDFGFARS